MSATSSIEALRANVQALLSPARFAHALRVAELTQAIAEAQGIEGKRGYLAGLLHDAAKELPPEELLRLAPPEEPYEAQHPQVLHGRAARRLAEAWGVDDLEVLEAIEDHVWGTEPGKLLGMALIVADVDEPEREVHLGLPERALKGDLLGAYREALRSKAEYLRARGIPLHPKTQLLLARLG